MLLLLLLLSERIGGDNLSMLDALTMNGDAQRDDDMPYRCDSA